MDLSLKLRGGGSLCSALQCLTAENERGNGVKQTFPMLMFFMLAAVVAWICRFFPSCGEFFKLTLMKGSQKATGKS